jgi:hypothetical protein
VWHLRDATVEELLGDAFHAVRAEVYKQDKSRVSCERVAGQQGSEHLSLGIYGIVSRYQTTTGEDTANWEDLVRAVVKCLVCELAIAL